jgi:hypothetical protein
MQLEKWGFTLKGIAKELMDMDQKNLACLKPDRDIPQQSQQDSRVLEAVLIQSRYVCTMVKHIALLANVNKEVHSIVVEHADNAKQAMDHSRYVSPLSRFSASN